MTSLAWMRPKLAELCGLKNGYWLSDDQFFVALQSNYAVAEEWHPDEDVPQAIRCLEVLRDAKPLTYAIYRAHRWRVEIEGNAACCANITGKSLPETVCLAIAAALGWKELYTPAGM